MKRSGKAALLIMLAVITGMVLACRPDGHLRRVRGTTGEHPPSSHTNPASEPEFRPGVHRAVLRIAPMPAFPHAGRLISTAMPAEPCRPHTRRTDIANTGASFGNMCHVQAGAAAGKTASTNTRAWIDETGRTSTCYGKPSETLSGRPRAAASEGRYPARAANCTLSRDTRLQSHFMLLSLCRHEERQPGRSLCYTPMPVPETTPYVIPAPAF